MVGLPASPSCQAWPVRGSLPPNVTSAPLGAWPVGPLARCRHLLHQGPGLRPRDWLLQRAGHRRRRRRRRRRRQRRRRQGAAGCAVTNVLRYAGAQFQIAGASLGVVQRPARARGFRIARSTACRHSRVLDRADRALVVPTRVRVQRVARRGLGRHRGDAEQGQGHVKRHWHCFRQFGMPPGARSSVKE